MTSAHVASTRRPPSVGLAAERQLCELALDRAGNIKEVAKLLGLGGYLLGSGDPQPAKSFDRHAGGQQPAVRGDLAHGAVIR